MGFSTNQKEILASAYPPHLTDVWRSYGLYQRFRHSSVHLYSFLVSVHQHSIFARSYPEGHKGLLTWRGYNSDSGVIADLNERSRLLVNVYRPGPWPLFILC